MRYVASGMYVMNSTKNLKTIIGFKLNDRNLFPSQIPRRVLNSGLWECCKRLILPQYERQYITCKLDMELKRQLVVSGTACRKPKDRL